MALVQIFSKFANIGEYLYGSITTGSQFVIKEIPFVSEELNYLDVVGVKPLLDNRLEDYYEYRETLARSGYQTIHLAFSEEIGLENRKRIVREMHEKGVAYRRVDMDYFALSIRPHPDQDRVIYYVNELVLKGIFTHDDRKISGVKSNLFTFIGYMQRPPILNDGRDQDGGIFNGS